MAAAAGMDGRRWPTPQRRRWPLGMVPPSTDPQGEVGEEGVQIWLVSHPNGGREGRRRRWREAERKGRRKEKKWVYVGVRKGYPRFGGEGGKEGADDRERGKRGRNNSVG